MPSYSFGPYLVRHPWHANSSHLSEPQKTNLLVRRLASNSLNFLQIPKNLHALPVRDVTRTLSSCFILGYCDISEWHSARVRITTCIKVLSLTKPKGMNRNPSAIILHCQRMEKPCNYFIKPDQINLFLFCIATT